MDYLLKELQVDPDEVTWIENVWSGGGNLGSCMEYFVGGMEIGNCVFMKYKYFPDGSIEELDVKVIDTGTGLERILWLVNGSVTPYMDMYPSALKYL